MDLSFLTDDELIALKQNDLTKISDESLLKLKQQNFDLKTLTASPKQPVKENNSGGFLSNLLRKVSPLNLVERAKFGFGNPQGILENLKSRGIDAEYRDGELYIGKGESARQADPSGLRTLLEAAFPPAAAYTAYENLDSQKRSENAERLLRDVKDIPADIAESPSDIMNAGMTTLGGLGGAAITGPLAPLGAVGGGAAGGGASEKLKQAVGEGLGVYKTSDEFLTPEVKREAAYGALSEVPGALVQTGKAFLKKGAEKLLDYKIPQRLYAGAARLPKDELDVAETLLKEGVTGSRAKLKDISSDQLKNIGAELRAKLSGKEANYDEIVSKIKNFESQFASGEVEGAKSALANVLDDFGKLFSQKEIPGGTMQRPSFEDFKTSILGKQTENPSKTKVFVSDPSKASEEDLLDYSLNKIISSDVPPNVRIKRTAGGFPVKSSPVYSEVRLEGRNLPVGRDIPEEFLKEPSQPRVFTPSDSPKVIDEYIPDATDEDLLRLYLQKYPNENLSLPPIKSAPQIDLADLNFEKSKLASSARKIYDNPDALAQANRKAQKQVADASRRVIEEKVPDIRPVNQRYHAYDVLNESMDNLLQQNIKTPFNLGLSDLAVGGGVGALDPATGVGAVAAKKLLESTAGGTNTAAFLYKLLNAAPKSGYKPSLSQPFLQLLLRNEFNNENLSQ